MQFCQSLTIANKSPQLTNRLYVLRNLCKNQILVFSGRFIKFLQGSFVWLPGVNNLFIVSNKPTRMKRIQLTLVLAFLLLIATTRTFERQRISCSSDSYSCGDNTKCVKGENLCDYTNDCNDFSDEKLSLCKMIHENRGRCTLPGQLYHSDFGCKDIIDICSSDFYQGQGPNKLRKLCDEIKDGLPQNEDFEVKNKEISALREKISTLEEQTSLKGVFESLVREFSACSESNGGCPMMYGKIKKERKCVALFSLAKLTWFEAKHFCESISGTLAVLDNMEDYRELLQHLRYQELTTDLWIGGRYHTDSMSPESSRWKWLDGQNVFMGVPFWSLTQNPHCSMRFPPPVCNPYSLAPRENRDGFCLSLDYAFHYYFIDQNCHERKSPLCFLNEKL